ncbi:hypothetical protein CRM22_003271 [Opisthorchis felineus]|uniref:Uncharacterized protein n=1 Tax=Opisthorchis felineus TaxID=147828 RepID=A0A4S2M239_OPIFE|nr:hypothetical protein CRM22_003271 [Opisthorchis felineus]
MGLFMSYFHKRFLPEALGDLLFSHVMRSILLRQTAEEEDSSFNAVDQPSGNDHVVDEPNEDAATPEVEDLSESEGSGFHDVDSLSNDEPDQSSENSLEHEGQTADEEDSSLNQAPDFSQSDGASEGEVDGGSQVDQTETDEVVSPEQEGQTVSKKQFIRGIHGECAADDYNEKLHGLTIATYQIRMDSSVGISQLFSQLMKPNAHGNNCRFNGYLQ